MENQLKQLKSQMLKGEMSSLEFTQEMKTEVISKMEYKRVKKQKNGFVPIILSFALLSFFVAGAYLLLTEKLNFIPGSNSPENEVPVNENPVVLPDLLGLTYIPEPYVLTTYENNQEMANYVYSSTEVEQDVISFSRYIEKPHLSQGESETLLLAAGIEGTFIQVGENHSYMTWSEGDFYYLLEQTGELEKVELYKIVDAWLIESGHQSLLAEEIEKLQSENVVDKGSLGSEVELSEEEAISLLERFENVKRSLLIGDDAGYDVNTGKFYDIKTKEELYSYFSDFMIPEAISKQVDPAVKEKEDGLYIVGIGGPPFFTPGQPYEFEKINENEYIVTQLMTDELFGGSTFMASFIKVNEKWMISYVGIEI